MHIRELQKDIHELAVEKGWYDSPREVPELLCLIHSEVSEALEAYRKSDSENMAEEFADIVIRVFDAAEYLGIDMEDEIVIKHERNKERSYRHGGKKC